MAFADRLFGGGRGLGIDIDPKRVETAMAAGQAAIVADATRARLDGRVRFAIMSHFLEHLPGIAEARRCLLAAANCTSDFILVQQPYFDADGYLLDRGLKFYWSDWVDHKLHLTSIQIFAILRAMLAMGVLAGFVIGRRKPVLDSSDPCIHSLASAPEQHDWSADRHPPKPTVAFDGNVFREVFAFAMLHQDAEKHLAIFLKKRAGEVVFDSRTSDPG